MEEYNSCGLWREVSFVMVSEVPEEDAGRESEKTRELSCGIVEQLEFEIDRWEVAEDHRGLAIPLNHSGLMLSACYWRMGHYVFLRKQHPGAIGKLE